MREVTRCVRLECGLSIMLGVVVSSVLNCRMLPNFVDRFWKSKSSHIITALKKKKSLRSAGMVKLWVGVVEEGFIKEMTDI